jgi:hypothetical protein
VLREVFICQHVGQFLGAIAGITRGRQGTNMGMQ